MMMRKWGKSIARTSPFHTDRLCGMEHFNTNQPTRQEAKDDDRPQIF